jgi:hypothetical protein
MTQNGRWFVLLRVRASAARTRNNESTGSLLAYGRGTFVGDRTRIQPLNQLPDFVADGTDLDKAREPGSRVPQAVARIYSNSQQSAF